MTSKILTLHVQKTFLGIIVYRRWTTTTWNVLISRFIDRGREHKIAIFYFFFWTWKHFILIQLQKNLPTS